ncbi:Nitrate and nitrite sensing [Asanoa hainanensis]|uniref:Nitrate and nitrite sensing n=1 Tax=Asanoa hainanensis TaxID=560556 RepID=A0A239N9Q6_9ACTN|nr:nitrate- and nitrite sensing domain-containing protein [Asanoa hainanensis]SNT51666.1 Nitrate and nitrite sensing [Asanoa hainanensis]
MRERPEKSTWLKIGLVMLVPILATVVLVGTGLRDGRDSTRQAEEARDLATVVAAAGGLVQGIQDERAAAGKLLGSYSMPQASRNRAAFESASGAVDGAVSAYVTRRAALTDVPSSVASPLAQIDDGLRGLAAHRSAIIGSTLAFTDAANAYNALVDSLLKLRDGVANLTADPALTQRMRVAATVSRQKEHLSRERLVVLQGYGAGALNQNLRSEFVAAQAGRREALEQFSAVATEEERHQLSQAVAGPDPRKVASYEGWILGVMPSTGRLMTAPFKVDTWDGALLEYGRLIRGVEAQFDSAVVDTAADAVDDERRELIVRTAVPGAVLLLALLVAWLVGRGMTRRRHEPGDGSNVPTNPDRPLAATRAGGV